MEFLQLGTFVFVVVIFFQVGHLMDIVKEKLRDK